MLRLAVLRHTWVQVFLSGIVVYGILDAAYIVTDNRNLLPGVILIGAFLVPATFVVYLFERLNAREIPLYTMLLTFFWGGAVAIAVAGFLEYGVVVALSAVPLIVVGFVEEGAKLIFPVGVYARHRYHLERDGILIGVASGMGFAALETMGYGLNAALTGGVDSLNITLIVRGILSPAAHASWTGYVAAVMWLELSRRGRPVFTGSILWAYLVAVLLHTFFNTFAALGGDSSLGASAVSFVGLAGVAVLSFGLLLWRVRQAERRALEVRRDEEGHFREQ